MKNLKQEIFRYVDNKRGSWSDSTISSAYSKLCTVDSIGWEPSKVYKELSSQGYSSYTIQTYFWIAKSFEEQVKKTRSFHKWLKDNRLRFKNCYKEKTKRISREEFEAFLTIASEGPLRDLLILLGRFGLRKSEAFNAKWEDFQDGRFCVQAGKGNKQRFLPRQWSQWLNNEGKSGFILPRSFNFSDFIKPFTPHDFRHYAVTSWINDDKLNLKQAAVLAGHASILTTARYIKADLSEIEEKLK